MSKSKTRRVAAIGNSRVIPAKAGIQWLCAFPSRDERHWVPAFAGTTQKDGDVAHPSKSKTRSVAAIGYGCVIPAQAGIQWRSNQRRWVPAFAGTTTNRIARTTNILGSGATMHANIAAEA
jgi:hypothetical protein